METVKKEQAHIKFNFTVSNLLDNISIRRITKQFTETHSITILDFIESLINELKISISISEKELQNIPKSGQFITVANHPYGTLEGLLKLKLILPFNEHYKIISNESLEKLKPIAKHLVYSNEKSQSKRLIHQLKQANELIKDSYSLGFFPALKTTSTNIITGGSTDKKWNNDILHFIKFSQLPIIPFYIKGNPNVVAQLLKIINKSNTTAKLSTELFTSKSRDITIRIGKPIYSKDYNTFTSFGQFGRYLRAKTHTLGSALEVKKFFVPQFKFPKKPEQIISEISSVQILDEINNLTNEKIISQQNMELYIAPTSKIPNILNEIGRLREITFREVGEGTNKSIDLDEYDLYYHHLFIWDKNANKIVGSYRIGKGDEIYTKYGKQGFYLSSLFKIKNGFIPYLLQTIELGRSFIVKEYQQKPLTLFMLWQGILYFLLENPQYRYMIGPVSISNYYSKLSKSLIVSFIKKYYFDNELSKIIIPKKKFKVNLKKYDAKAMLELEDPDMKKFDKIISDIEPRNFSMPILLKKYLSINAKILSFNIDPKFNDALDGLVLLDFQKVPKDIIDRLKEELLK